MATPAGFLERIAQQRVTVRLKDRRTITGRLVGSDDHLNLVLDEAEVTTPELSRRLGRVVLRGSNVVSLTTPAEAPAKAP